MRQLYVRFCSFQFKSSDILTYECLEEKILNSSILPKPSCHSLNYTYDWKSFIIPHLEDPQLTNHSKYNSFKIVNEDGIAKLRAKRLPQQSDTELYPQTGIAVLRRGIEFEGIGSAEFRVEDIKFDKILHGLRCVTCKLSLEKRMAIETSWNNLRHRIESLPLRRTYLRKMNILNFPKQDVIEGCDLDVDLEDHVDSEKKLSGNICQEEIVEGNVREDIRIGSDVCVYTASRRSRPWVGRVTEVLGDTFIIHWYSRKPSKRNEFCAMTNYDGSPYQSDQHVESIMFWDMSENRKADSFTLSNYWLEAIKEEYAKLDLGDD